MKQLILCLLTAGLALNASGQENYIGFEVLGSRTGLSQNNWDGFTNQPRKSLSAGITYEKVWQEKYGVEIDVFYLRRGGKEEVTYRFDDQMVYEREGGMEALIYYYNYIGMPVKASFYWGDKVYFSPKLGIIPALLLNSGYISQYPDDSERSDKTDQVKPFDLAGVLELTGGYRFEDRFRIFTSLSGMESITSLSTDDHFPASNLRHGGLSISLGLKYQLPD